MFDKSTATKQHVHEAQKGNKIHCEMDKIITFQTKID